MKNYIKYNGGSLWTCESGQINAHPVLLCNGGPGCCDYLRALLYIAGNGIQNDRNWNEEYHRNLDERGERLPDMDYPFNTAVNMAGNRTLREFGRAPDFYLRVSRMDMPALFVMAENDIRPSWPAEQLASLMPCAKIVRVKNASHFIWLDNPKELQKVLSEFISQL